ncbi:MAG: biotin/lipoyl-containing protein [Terriglobales bacterium]
MKMQIVIGGKAYEVEVQVEGDANLPASGQRQSEPGPIQSKLVPTPPRSHAHAEGEADESKLCRSPVAGIVVRVCVQPGQELQLDDLLVVLEAMKMETSLTAPIPGKVKSVKVASGEAVKLNQILIEFE